MSEQNVKWRLPRTRGQIVEIDGANLTLFLLHKIVLLMFLVIFIPSVRITVSFDCFDLIFGRFEAVAP